MILPMKEYIATIALTLLALIQAGFAQYPGWQHTGSFYILTNPEGADLPATATEEGFPLWLRLDKDAFGEERGQQRLALADPRDRLDGHRVNAEQQPDHRGDGRDEPAVAEVDLRLQVGSVSRAVSDHDWLGE